MTASKKQAEKTAAKVPAKKPAKTPATPPKDEEDKSDVVAADASGATPTEGGASARSAPPSTKPESDTADAAGGAAEGSGGKPDGEPPAPSANPEGSPRTPTGLIPVLIVTAKQDQRRRAGFAFGREPVKFGPGGLTQEQYEAIMADPVLVTSKDFE